LKPLPNEVLAIIIKINLTTNYQLLLNCNKVHRAPCLTHTPPVFGIYGKIDLIKTCPMHLVTVKVKIDSFLLIKIIVFIKVILGLVEGFYLFQNLNIKLTSTLILRRKEIKMVLYFVTASMAVYLPPVLKLQ
jgi:hypothetical protein